MRIGLTISWNTGALYQAHGQVITARIAGVSGTVVFADHSRSISGSLDRPFEGTTEEALRRFPSNSSPLEVGTRWNLTMRAHLRHSSIGIGR